MHEEERELIQQWRSNRLQGVRNSYHECLLYSLNLDTLKSFLQNFNFMVFIQMVIATIAVYVFQSLQISFDINVSVFVSPIVFPLAFSINTDFQRREKVLEDLAVFKSSGLVWYFCMREWKHAAKLDALWITAVHSKLKSLLFHLCEYLLTAKIEHRKIILRAMYQDFSDANQLIENLRESQLPANTAIISRSIHLLNMMCLSFERLRVIREYRSPRSVRSFNKVFIMLLPIILAPYFVHLGIKGNNTWQPYYLAVLLAYVFSTLQSVQDKLDDPFDGMGEDDINLDTIDEWALCSFQHVKKTFNVGRFKVNVDPKDNLTYPEFVNEVSIQNSPCVHTNSNQYCPDLNDYTFGYEKYVPMLETMKGNTPITRRGIHKRYCPMVNGDRFSQYIMNIDDTPGQSEERIKGESFSNEPVTPSDIDGVKFRLYSYPEANEANGDLISGNINGDISIDCKPRQQYSKRSILIDMKYPSWDYEFPLDMSMCGNGKNFRKSYINTKQTWQKVNSYSTSSENSLSSRISCSSPCGEINCINRKCTGEYNG